MGPMRPCFRQLKTGKINRCRICLPMLLAAQYRRMSLEIVNYPHPTLRFRSLPIKRVDKALRMLADEMLELMYEHEGVGLAANQVHLPLQMFVINPSGARGEGQEQILINPVIQRPKGSELDREGCLSVPGLYGNVMRSKQIQLTAYDLKGNPIDIQCEGFLARVLQHENDHLEGTMFFDRMSEESRRELLPMLEEFEVDFQSKREGGAIGSDEQLDAERREWIARYA